MSSYQFLTEVDTSYIAFFMEQPPNLKSCINQLQETFRQAYIVAGIERQQLASNVIEIGSNLRPKHDTDKGSVGVANDGSKHQDLKNKVLIIKRLCQRYKLRTINDDVDVLSTNLLNVYFSSEDQRPRNWNPKDSLIIIACIRQKKIHCVYIANGSITEIFYRHCFRQLLSSQKEDLKLSIGGSLVYFTRHSLWLMGSIHLPLMFFYHDQGKESYERSSSQSYASQHIKTYCSGGRCLSNCMSYR